MKQIMFILIMLILVGCNSTAKVEQYEKCQVTDASFVSEQGSEFTLKAKDDNCFTGLILEANYVYRFDIISFTDTWQDGDSGSLSVSQGLNEKGWDTSWLPFYLKWIALFDHTKQCKNAKWFELIAILEDSSGYKTHIRIGEGISKNKILTNTWGDNVRLYFYANDKLDKYANNHGEVYIRVTPITLTDFDSSLQYSICND